LLKSYCPDTQGTQQIDCCTGH